MAWMKQKEKTPLGIYVHVPFCRSKCQYCDFYSVTEKEDSLIDGYLNAVCEHIRQTGKLAPNYKVDTIYFGGGTPSFLGAEGLSLILSVIRKSFQVASDAEITFEANPDSVSEKLLKRLYAEGFNRVSLGIQNDDDEMLRKLGRPHTYGQAVTAVHRIRKAGFRNVSVDLMYGLPGQSLAAWEETLRHVLALVPDHVSCYGLTLEEGTPMHRYQDALDIPDEDTQAAMYLRGVDILRSKGYRQYEISNFARKGMTSRHNFKYWMGEEYVGFGPNAASDFGGKRFTMVRSLRDYIQGIAEGGQVVSEVIEIPRRERAGEYLMTRLRTTEGINGKDYEQRFLLPFAPIEAALKVFQGRGHATRNTDGSWCFTPEGFLISNSLISDVLLAQERSLK